MARGDIAKPTKEDVRKSNVDTVPPLPCLDDMTAEEFDEMMRNSLQDAENGDVYDLDEAFDEMMRIGLEQAKNGQGYDADEVFDKLLKNTP